MQPFLSEAQQTSTSTPMKKIVEKDEDTMSESTKEDMDVLIKGILEFKFEHLPLKKKYLKENLVYGQIPNRPGSVQQKERGLCSHPLDQNSKPPWKKHDMRSQKDINTQ